MLWLSLFLPNPFKYDDQNPSLPPPYPSTPPSSAVKDDISVLTHQLCGAPLPPQHSMTALASDDETTSYSQAILGIKNDLVEIGDNLKTGISLLASNKVVSGISLFASRLLPFQNDGDEAERDEGDVTVGITEEVLDFVGEISLQHECWTDFPLSLPNGIFDFTSLYAYL
ncbi:unnamed protein product [Ilex paraguariensis]|uniref:Uncharacterized protein n=1 Tax=Ilex paraguariensis TaxID=185542 RepID=A0ABC8RKJ5_9AQUA